jgi:hypothetical protein
MVSHPRSQSAEIRKPKSANPRVNPNIVQIASTTRGHQESDTANNQRTATGDVLAIDPIDVSELTDSNVTIATLAAIDSDSMTSPTDPVMTAIDEANLQTEPNLPLQAEPSNPDLVEARNQPDDPDVPRAAPSQLIPTRRVSEDPIPRALHAIHRLAPTSLPTAPLVAGGQL